MFDSVCMLIATLLHVSYCRFSSGLGFKFFVCLDFSENDSSEHVCYVMLLELSADCCFTHWHSWFK